MRDFNEWLATFCKTIYDYKYYVDFEKAFRNASELKVQLNILNSLIGSEDIENEFCKLLDEYPKICRCIPILLAIRKYKIDIYDVKPIIFDFSKSEHFVDNKSAYLYFMRESGLFDAISKKIISNLCDYVFGVEVGLDSNARKNRTGHVMENIVEQHIKACGLIKEENYFKEIYISELENKFDIDLSTISSNGKAEKRFDYAVKTSNMLYLIECNFYGSGGSKLNETARSYEEITKECANISGATFVWITDGQGWNDAKNNLAKTFAVLKHLYNLSDLENGALKRLFNETRA